MGENGNNRISSQTDTLICSLALLFDLHKMNQYPREAWRPVLEGSFPAFEQGSVHPARAWDLVEGLHLRLHHHIVSRDGGGKGTRTKCVSLTTNHADSKLKCVSITKVLK